MKQETDEISNPWASLDNDAEDLVSPVTNTIYNGILSEMRKKKRSTNINRGSNASRCERALGYAQRGYPAKEMAPRTNNNLSLGHVAEAVLKAQIKKYCVGEDRFYKRVIFGDVISTTQIGDLDIEVHAQLEGSFSFSAHGQEHNILCHFDGIGELQNGDMELIEIKSSSSYGFNEFKREGPGNYLLQAQAYMMTDACVKRGVKQVRFFYVRKDTGHILDRVFPFSDDLCDEVLAKFTKAHSPIVPDRPYEPIDELYYKKPTGRKKLHWMCSYCAYTELCWPNAVREYKKDNFGNRKPTYYVEK